MKLTTCILSCVVCSYKLFFFHSHFTFSFCLTFLCIIPFANFLFFLFSDRIIYSVCGWFEKKNIIKLIVEKKNVFLLQKKINNIRIYVKTGDLTVASHLKCSIRKLFFLNLSKNTFNMGPSKALSHLIMTAFTIYYSGISIFLIFSLSTT